MRTHTKIFARTVLLAAGWFAGCNGTIDSEPNVVLEVETMTVPPVTAATASGVCTFTIANASATLKNKPKNAQAGTTVFNDIVLDRVLVSYSWENGTTTTGTAFGVGGTVPAGGSASAQFVLVNNAILAAQAPQGGQTAAMRLQFFGTTVAGEPVSATTGGSLVVNSCPPAAVGACCISGVCSVRTSLDCTNSGGTYTSDNTPCPANGTCP